MRLTAIALLVALAATPALTVTQALAADPIPATEAAQHVGETVTVVGILNGYRFGGIKHPTYWNIDGAYPNNAFTALIPSRDASKFPNMKPLIGRKIAITGTIELYNGKPQIVLSDISQVQVEH